jgi:hypothetical protein
MCRHRLESALFVPSRCGGPPPGQEFPRVALTLDLDELSEYFTLLPDESALLRNKTGATRLGFALVLKHLIWKGRFPRGRSDLPDEAGGVRRQAG